MSLIKTRVFLTGAVNGISSDRLNEFVRMEGILKAAGFEVSTAIDGLPAGSQVGNADAIKYYLKCRKENLIAADMVLHMEAYEMDQKSMEEINYARNNGKRVLSAQSFLSTELVAKDDL